VKPGCTQTAGKTSSSWDCCNPSTCPRRRLPAWRDPVMRGPLMRSGRGRLTIRTHSVVVFPAAFMGGKQGAG
jgi:hypothetical protein